MASASDDFADGVIDPIWTQVQGTWSETGGSIFTTTTSPHVMRCETAMDTPDHAVDIVIPNPGTPNGFSAAALVRMTQDPAGTLTCYLGRFYRTDNEWQIYRFVDGASTQLDAIAGTPPTTPWTLRFEALGDTLTLIGAGIQRLQVQDAAVEGYRGGIRGNSRVGIGVGNFTVADITPSSALDIYAAAGGAWEPTTVLAASGGEWL